MLAEIRRLLSARYGEAFDSIGFNCYRDGDDSVAWHGDRHRHTVDDPVVAIVSVGAPRPFRLRPRGGGRRAVVRPRPRRPVRDGRGVPARLGAHRPQGPRRRAADLDHLPPRRPLAASWSGWWSPLRPRSRPKRGSSGGVVPGDSAGRPSVPSDRWSCWSRSSTAPTLHRRRPGGRAGRDVRRRRRRARRSSSRADGGTLADRPHRPDAAPRRPRRRRRRALRRPADARRLGQRRLLGRRPRRSARRSS